MAKKYHHLFDPKTGYPFDNDMRKCHDHKQINQLMVMGCLQQSFNGCEKDWNTSKAEVNNGTEAIFVTKDDKVYVTDPIKEHLQIIRRTPITRWVTVLN